MSLPETNSAPGLVRLRGAGPAEGARDRCTQLERGAILFFAESPVVISKADGDFLRSQEQDSSGFHKNISYRPRQDALRGYASNQRADAERMHGIMRNYSRQVTQFLAASLEPYAARWSIDFASFRPLEEAGRDLPLHKRNDLLHVDAFPTRPTRGGRILRFFTNIHPERPRVWHTTERFGALAKHFAQSAGLERIAAGAKSSRGMLERQLAWLKQMFRLGQGRTKYDEFMLHFHDYLKENHELQAKWPKQRIEFPPFSSWMVFTDGVPHAVLSGQYALEQTYIIPPEALVDPQDSPLRILEGVCGRRLAA